MKEKYNRKGTVLPFLLPSFHQSRDYATDLLMADEPFYRGNSTFQV